MNLLKHRYHYINRGPLKAVVVILLLSLCLLFSAWNYLGEPVPAAGYQFIYPANFGNRINVPNNNPTTKQGVYLGRLLFYEKQLSANNTVSCGSCHKQSLAFTDGRAFSPGLDGVLSARNSMSLANQLWARKFFWDGRAASLEDQAVVPLTNQHEMGQALAISAKKISKIAGYPALFKQAFGDPAVTPDRICRSIAQFERTLISANSKYDQYLRNAYKPTEDELKGMALFETAPQPAAGIRGANCAHCHGGIKNYMELFHNNGLDSIPKDAGIELLTQFAGDRGRFKVPTLRNIALTAPYMHDGRFKTLAEVVNHYSNHIKESASLSTFIRGESNNIGGKLLNLLPNEKKEILAFLNMLTDTDFINNPNFSDPYSRITKK